MSAIENEAWIEAVALAAINDRRGRHGWPPMNTIPEGFHNADEWRAQARAAIRALFPLVIERCGEEVIAYCRRRYVETGSGEEIASALRTLIPKEASDA
ncbi:hypothetical protein [Prosthecomicrobium hirschii]|uniref:hypothetical protein n=1 Tax=Prosthecodimorpha hirschii TaxID=665126 RepID=UPI00221E8165|nr:hypothetical protein [Prosthecomicrobium hirschii]MCW1839482.1 hypothetical protein [Prosthecomicrobium hirschii]